MKKQILNEFISKSGKLVEIRIKNKPAFKIKRIFIITSKKNTKRGGHAHQKCNQILISLKTKFKIILNKKKKLIINSRDNELIYVPKLNWVDLEFKEKDIVLVLCDRKYEKKDYIYDFNDLKKVKSHFKK